MGGRMYAIAFDLDARVLQTSYGKPVWQNANGEIKAILASKGFVWQSGNVYFGGDKMTAMCVGRASVKRRVAVVQGRGQGYSDAAHRRVQ